MLKNSSVIPRSLGDEESAFRNLLISHNSGLLVSLGMTPESMAAAEFQQPVRPQS